MLFVFLLYLLLSFFVVVVLGGSVVVDRPVSAGMFLVFK